MHLSGCGGEHTLPATRIKRVDQVLQERCKRSLDSWRLWQGAVCLWTGQGLQSSPKEGSRAAGVSGHKAYTLVQVSGPGEGKNTEGASVSTRQVNTFSPGPTPS
jgi:hypothetical protein